MHVLFLGPPSLCIEECLYSRGHRVRREQGPLPTAFFEAEPFDLCLVYRYQYSLSPEIAHCFRGRSLHLHLSFLPWNRGSDPHLWSFLEDTPKGVTIYRPDADMDTGDILLQQEVRFASSDATLRSTYTLLSQTMERLFVEHAEQLLARQTPSFRQSAHGSCHTACDKVPWLHLLEECWWDTPAASLIGKAKAPAPESGARVVLRAAGPDDAAFVFQLVNEPDVRAMSFCSTAIPWEIHRRWFAAELDSGNPFYIALYNGRPCGYIRFKKDADSLHEEEWTLSLAICPHFRGKGLGVDMTRAASRSVLRNASIRRIRAWVKQQNAASLRTFERSGFVRTDAASPHGEDAVSFLYPGYEE